MRNKLFTPLLLLMMQIAPTSAWTATPPVATYEPVRDLEGYRPLAFQPWSSDGHQLAVIGKKNELCVWDVSRPESAPRVLAKRADELAKWSPDGGWLLFEGFDRADSLCLIAVRTSDASRDTFRLPRVWPYWWASDGRIYGWTGPDVAIFHPGDHWRRRRVVAGPPKLWSSEHPGPHLAKAVVLPPDPFGFLPGPEPREWDLAVTQEPRVRYVLLESTFPGDSLFLVYAGGSNPAESRGDCVMDLKGNVIREVNDPNPTKVGDCVDRAEWSSVSADGKYLLGARELHRAPYLNGHPHSIVYLGDPRGHWSTPVKGAPDGVSPRWASGYLYCADDLTTGVLHVGRIRFAK